MRPLVVMATFLFLLALTAVSAQHGGGHVSAGGHGGMAGHSGGMAGQSGFKGHAGFSGHPGGQAFGGAHSGPGFRSRPPSRVFPSSRQPLASRNSNRFRGEHRGPRIRARGFRNDCFWNGCNWGYAYPYLGGGIDPYWWWDSGSSYDEDREREISMANEMNAQSLEEQRMRRQDDQDAYAGSAPAQPREQDPEEAAPATVLVFRDQHRQEVQNYAIVGQMLWTFAPQHTQKIPLSDLDLPATTKANDERGVDFRVPGAHEGQ